jgi:hypothetical protein
VRADGVRGFPKKNGMRFINSPNNIHIRIFYEPPICLFDPFKCALDAPPSFSEGFVAHNAFFISQKR